MRNLFLALLVFSAISCELNEPVSHSGGCDFLNLTNKLDDARCGYLDVPETHQKPYDRSIRIAYVVLKARNVSHNNHPMVYFSGGPGQPLLIPKSLAQWNKSAIREHRDIVLFDQRGINHSSALPNMGSELFEILAADADVATEYFLTKDLIDAYRQRAISQGIQLEHYNSFETAQDVRMLMAHLGYDKYNLFGGSYGTRLARIVQDIYPEQINSVVLQSPNPLGDDFLVSRLRSYSLALERILENCQADPACGSVSSELREDYLIGIEALRNNPLKVSTGETAFYVNPQDALYFLRRVLYGNDSKATVPVFIQSIKNRETEFIRKIVEREQTTFMSYNFSMWLSVERYETFDSEFTSEVVDEIYRTLPLLPDKLGLFTSFYFAGHDWHESALLSSEKHFKHSDVPTIIFVNQYDPTTPPENGKALQKRLSNSQLFVLDEGGHGGGDMDCLFNVVAEFMDDPSQPLDTECLNLFESPDL